MSKVVTFFKRFHIVVCRDGLWGRKVAVAVAMPPLQHARAGARKWRRSVSIAKTTLVTTSASSLALPMAW